MSSLVHRWLLLCGITLFVFNKGCHGFFLRHAPSGRSGSCITRSDERVFNVTSGLSYYVVMTDNCLNDSGQFRYRNNEMLDHIDTGGTLVAPPDDNYHSRWAVFKGVSTSEESYQSNPVHRLKQTAAGSLQFYQRGTICAEPSKPYVLSKTYCDKSKQQFTFGSVTNYGTKMENVHCSPMQRMAIKRVDYGDFKNNEVFDGSASIDTQCSPLSNCQVKSRCGGKRSCALTMGSNLLSSPYCHDNLKEIYIEYTCVDSNSSSPGSIITAATNMRLTHWANEGFIQIKDGLIWRTVKEEHWDKNRQKMLCQHLGFKETDTNDISPNYLITTGRNIATGSLICYSTRGSKTSCCINLVRSTSTSNSQMTWAKCKICDKPLSLSDVDTFSPNKVFSGSGGSKYYGNVRSSRAGWCASGSTPYLLLDLQKEYHLTHVMVIADKEQTKWSNVYSMKYSRVETLIDSRSLQITGNQNGYQASITQLDRVYNARYIKIQSNRNTDFCLRIELCGEVQTPAPAYDINITPYKYAARVTWRIRTRPEDFSYITKINLYLNRRKYQTISRGTSVIIKRLKPFTQYKVEIETEDGSSEKSKKVGKDFRTKRAGKICDKPLSLSDDNKFSPSKVFSGSGGSKYGDVRFTKRGWCASGSTPYLLLDLQKEYHLTHVMVIADKEQTKWSTSYSMKYSRVETLIDNSRSIQITGNQNGYQASITQLDRVYNARYVKIQSTRNTDFCLRIELCGNVQTPAAVNSLRITQYQYAAYVTWRIRTAPEDSSYITKMIIYIDGSEYQTISQRQRTYIVIKRFKPNTPYKVEIQTEDSYQQKSGKVSASFTTNTAGKICEKPLLQDTRTIPDNAFSGSGGSTYQNARLTKAGWCASGSQPYLSINLQKEYHLTQVVVITDKTQRSSTYSLTYRRTGTWINRDIQITENRYPYQPFIKQLDRVYNAKYVKIQSTATGKIHFCLRIELCGEVQTPAPVNDIKVTPSSTSAQVTLGNPAPETSSYITHYYIKLNGSYRKTIRRQESRTEFSITGLTAFTKYTVTIYAGDGSSRWSSRADKIFTTNTAVPSGAPGSVAFTNRSKEQLTVSWSAPSRNSQNGELTGYRVCYSHKARSSSPSCSPKNAQTYTAQINNLQSATKYFVTVEAATTAGYGPKSKEISKITNGERVNPVAMSYSSLNLTITKPATYIKEVMIIVKVAPKNREVERIEKSDLKPYYVNTKDPYVTAYLKADALPLTFVIGDGMEYINSGKEKYFNQPLEQNSYYVTFLRFFESQDSYYSTGWSNIVKTMIKPPAPVNLNFFSTAPKKYTISWTQPFLPEQTTVLKYYGNYSASQGISKTLRISAEMRSVTIDVEFEKRYTFEIQVETRAGRSDVTSKSWTSHSAPLKPLNITDGYTVMLRKPKKEQKIKTVALVILQLQSAEANKPPAPENLNVENSPPSDTKADNVVFIAKQFDITEFQNDTVEIFLRESKGNRRRKRDAVDVYTLIPNKMYRIAQMNTDGSGNSFWSYWSDSFTFTKVIKDDRDGESGGGSVADGDDSGDPGKRDDGGGSVGAAVGASFAVVVIIIAVVLAFIFFRRRRPREQHENEDKNKDKEIKAVSEDEDNLDEDNQEGIYLNKNDDVEENVHPPVPIAEFAHYVNEMKANDNYEFQKEYDDLPSNTNTAWEVAKKPFNKQKNRYGNIVTYDHCRVVLSGDEKDDYINASYMDGIKENAYIATQGPTLLTLNDMWRMVWEQRSYSIVMVTSLVELLKPKCDKYWPDEGTEKYGDIEVTLMKIEEFAYYVIHTLQLKKNKEEREVRHYFFQSWPDHGVPKYPTQILAFRRHFRTHHMEQSGPIIVHCSAGVGRTGVFLAIDTIIDKLEKGVINSIDVFGQVCAMRERRMFMVQTLAQYIFVHEAILESILCGMNEVDSANVQKEMETLGEAKDNGMTGFQEKFKRLGEVSPKLSPDECAAALSKGNRKKNRNKDIYPAECNRVPLHSVDGAENSDYINAVFVQGYLGKDYFIATQSPLPNTINDFWRLVHLQRSSTIVLLNNVKNGTSFPKFWPTNRGESKQYDSLTVQLDSEKQSGGIWTRKFILSPHPDLSDGQVVNIFHYTKWPDHQIPPDADAVITLTSLVENSIKNYGLGPIIVVCSDGAGRTGTYIAISNLLERMKIEQAMDVFQAIKMIRGTRPQFVENAEQYKFCYTAIMAYLDGFSDYANFE